mgnify:FL=1
MTKTEKLLARHAKELESARVEDLVLEGLPEDCKPRFVHHSPLYGREAVLKFEGDLSEALSVARSLPANVGGKAYFANGASYLVPRFHMDDPSTDIHGKAQASKEEPTILDPTTVVIPSTGSSAEIHWHHKLSLPLGRSIVVEVCFSIPAHLVGRRDIKWAGDSHGRWITEESFHHSDLGSNWGYIQKRFHTSSEYPSRYVVAFPAVEEGDVYFRDDYVMTPERLFSYLIERDG